MKDNEQSRGWVVFGVLGLGVLAIGSSCLRVDEGHCMFRGGNEACGAGFCAAAVEGGSDVLTGLDASGCLDDEPPADDEGVAYVRYGLVESMGALEDILRREGVDVDTCDRLPDPARLLTGMTEDLRERGRARRSAAALTAGQRTAIHALNEEIERAVRECGGGPTTETTTTETSTTDGTTQSSGDSTTGPSGCMEDLDCPDGESPLCGAMGECVACNDPTAGGDAGCAAKNGSVCAEEGPREGQCVECTEAAADACTGVPPLCDLETNVCLPCTEHAQCGDAACNLYTGVCLPNDAVVHVGPGQRFTTLGEAIGSFAEGAEGTLVVHQADYNEAATVDGGRVLAFLAAEGTTPLWILAGGGSPQLTVGDATVLMDGLQLSGNAATAHPGLRVTGGRAWVDRGRVVGNDGGGVVAEEGAELVLRNCFVGGDVSDVNALEVNGASASVLYTTLGAGTVTAIGLSCSAPVTVTVRNALIVARGIEATGGLDIVCDEADVAFTATEAAFDGEGNQTLGELPTMMPQAWFQDFNSGDFHLAPTHPPAIATTARWEDGDPLLDMDGDPRPARDGAPDFAGADVP